jgi:molecular chaperone DnaK
VGGTTRIPLVQKRTREFFNKEPNKKVNPDEIVAMGAATQGAIVKGESKDILLLDVTPLSLGVKTYGGAFTRIIENNTTIPTNRSLVFSTVEDYQQEVDIMVYQGEREIAQENKLLGKFTLTEIKPAPKGVPRIEVTFNININGILTVSAVDLSTKSKKEVVVTHSGLLSEEEIEEIKKNAKRYKKSDLKRKELITLKNKIVNYIYSIKKVLENADVDPQSASDAQVLIKSAHQAMEREVPQDLEKVREELAAMEREVSIYMTEFEPGTEAPAPSQRPISIAEEWEKEIETGKYPGEILEEKITATGLVRQEAKKMIKEILNYASSIEQFIQNENLEEDIVTEAQTLIKIAHYEVNQDKPQNLGKLHQELEDMTLRLDDLVSRTLGISEEEKSSANTGIEEKNQGKDDTKPFRVFSD